MNRNGRMCYEKRLLQVRESRKGMQFQEGNKRYERDKDRTKKYVVLENNLNVSGKKKRASEKESEEMNIVKIYPAK